MTQISYNLTEKESKNLSTKGLTDKIKLDNIGIEGSRINYKILLDGELVLKGDISILGNWLDKKPIKTSKKDNWLYTGILVTEDNEGYISIKGRKKDINYKTANKNNYKYKEIYIPLAFLAFYLIMLIFNLIENYY